MSLPISWVVAGAIPASQAIKQTANFAATSASRFFGEFLQTNPVSQSPSVVDNGHSEQIEPILNTKGSRNDGKSLGERIDSLRSYLSKFVNESRARYGLGPATGKPDSFSISSNGRETPKLNGPEPARSELENHLQENPAIINEINELALQSSSTAPLRLLPKSGGQVPMHEPWILWIDT